MKTILTTLAMVAVLSVLAYFIFIPEAKRLNRWQKNIDIADYHEHQLHRLNDSMAKYVRDFNSNMFYIFRDSFDYHYNQVFSHVWKDTE